MEIIMTTRMIRVMTCLFCLVFLVSCESDKGMPFIPQEQSEWPDLGEIDNIFEYLALAWNRCDVDRYADILDEDFTHFRSESGYGSSADHRIWDRDAELECFKRMCRIEYDREKYGDVATIDFALIPEGLWIEVPQTAPPYAGETWYLKTVSYRLNVTTNTGWKVHHSDIKALFFIRQAEVDGKNIWRIIQWRDYFF